MITTIKDLLKEHPDWENLPLNCLHQIALEKEKPNRELFYKQIDAFNKREQFYDHYVEMPDKQIMHIYWHNGIWNYRVFKIEKPTKLER